MKSIDFDSGFKTYAINGDESCVIKINTTDFNLPKRIQDANETIKATISEYEGKNAADDIAGFDTKVRDIINEVFGSDICTPAFGKTNLFSITSNGNYIFENFLGALLPVIQADIEEAAKAAQVRPEVQKYLEEK